MKNIQETLIYIFIYLLIQTIFKDIQVKLSFNCLFLSFLACKDHYFNKFENKYRYLFIFVLSSVNLYGNIIDVNVNIYELLLMIVVSIIEEILFRYFLFNSIKNKYSIIITSLIFSLLHLMNINATRDIQILLFELIYRFFMGYLFETLYLETDSLLLPTLGHILINVSAMLVNGQFNIKYYMISLIYIIVYTIYLKINE